MTQTVIASIIVALAGAWLAKRVYSTLVAAVTGKIDKMGSCGSCSRNVANRQPPVVQLELSRPRGRKDATS